MRPRFSYPAFPVRIDPEPSWLRSLLVFGYVALLFALAACYYFFDDSGILIDFILTNWEFPASQLEDFPVYVGGAFVAGLVYLGAFSWVGIRRGMSWRQAIHALVPGLSGFLLYGAFVFHGNRHFADGPEAYLIARLPLAMALFWPFWRLKLCRGWAPSELTSGARLGLAIVALVFGFVLWFDPTLHAFFKWRAWEHNLPDMGLYVQMVWGFSRGDLMLHNTSYAKPNDSFLYGEHSLFSTALFTPAAWTPDPALTLVLMQAVMFLLGAWFVSRLARHFTSLPWVTWAMAIMFLGSPFVERSIIDDFHIDALETLLYLALWLVAMGGFSWARMAGFVALLVAYLGCKEDAGLTIGCMGAVMLFSSKTRAYGVVALLVGPVTTVALVKLIKNLGGGSAHLHNYQAFGESPGEIAATFITRPDIVLWELFQTDRRFTIMRLLVSVGFLAILAPEGVVLMGGAIVTTLLSSWDKQHRLETHYGLDFLGPLMVTALIGWRRVEALTAFVTQCPEQRTIAERTAADVDRVASGAAPLPAAGTDEWNQHASEFEWRSMLLAAVALGLTLSAHLEYAKYPAVRPLSWHSETFIDPRRDEFSERIAPLIRPDDGVATQNHLGSMFASRAYVGWFPPPVGFRTPGMGFALNDRVTVILIDARGEMGDRNDMRWWTEAAIENGFGVEAAWEGFLLLRKGHEPEDAEAAAQQLADTLAEL